MILLKIIFLIFILLLLVTMINAEENYSTSSIVNAIWIIEGGFKTNYPFGIRSVKCKGYNDCRQVCVNTVENNKERFKNQIKEKDFLVFLAKKYCPNNWKVWVKNLKYFLK